MQVNAGWASIFTCGILRPYDRVRSSDPSGFSTNGAKIIVSLSSLPTNASLPSPGAQMLMSSPVSPTSTSLLGDLSLLRPADEDVVVGAGEQRVAAEVADEQVVVVAAEQDVGVVHVLLGGDPGGWMKGLAALSLSRPTVTSFAGVPGSSTAEEPEARPTTTSPAVTSAAATP